jgi:molecular chaperone GrpE
MAEELKKEPEKKDELEETKKTLEDERKRSEECLARMKYLQADLENAKKRFDRQIEEVKKYANERLILELLDAVDELEMAIKSAHSTNSTETLTQGVEMTLKKITKVLKDEGVSQIECLGKPFDPSKHSAIAKTEKEGTEGCTITEEVRKGYVMKDKVIRPSIVKVTMNPTSKSQEEMKENE